MGCSSQKGKRKITNEDETFVRLGLALHTAEELRHEIYRRYIFQISRRRHFSPVFCLSKVGKWGMGERLKEGLWVEDSLLEFFVVEMYLNFQQHAFFFI